VRYTDLVVDTRYRVSPAAVYSLKYHLVWCPKYRLQVLVGPVQKRLRQLLYQKAKELDADIHVLEIMSDHVDMFVESDPDLLPRILRHSSKGSPLTNCENSSRGLNLECLRSGAAATT
jgi:putative transposase